MVAKGDSLADILDSLCLLVEEQSSGVLASILLMDPNGKQLRHGGAPNLPKAYTDAIDGLLSDLLSAHAVQPHTGRTGHCVRHRSDPLWADFRDLALAIRFALVGPRRFSPPKAK